MDHDPGAAEAAGSPLTGLFAEPLVPPDNIADLGEWIDGLIQGFTAHPDPDVRERVFALLDGVDALHRAAFTRLSAILQAPGGAAAWREVRKDPLLRAVLGLYDLEPPPLPPPPVRASGQLGGKPVLSMRVVQDAQPPAAVARPAPPAPEWVDVTPLAELWLGTLRGFRIADEAVVLGNAGGDVFAYYDACPDTPLALSVGQLDGEAIVCPWHGCRFDLRTGQRLVHRGTNLESFPVSIVDNVIRVAVNLPGAVLGQTSPIPSPVTP